MRYRYTVVFLFAVLLSGCNFSVNKSIHISDGRTVRTSLNAVNGNVNVGSDCIIQGSCRSVNGYVRIGSGTEVGGLQAVNGGIEVGRDVDIHGDIESVNGSVDCEPGCEIRGSVETVNGSVDLENVLVQRGISTYNGDVSLWDRSVVKKDIIIKRIRGDSRRIRNLTIEISEDSVVEGDIVVQDSNINAKVILSRGGRVLGRIRNAELIEE